MSLTLTTNISSAADVPQRQACDGPILDIGPPQGWQTIDLREVWRHRTLLFFFAWRDLKVRYKQTILGVAWALLQPAVMTIIFSLVLRGGGASHPAIPYPVFVLLGLILWNLFASSLGNAANSLVASEHLITKIYFPRILLPLSALGPCLVDFGIAGLFGGALLLWYQVPVGWTLPLAALPILVVISLTVGLGSLLAALNITYRDFRHTTAFMLQAWLFGTPAIFMASLETSHMTWKPATATTWFVLANPLNGCIAFFRAAVLGLPLPWLMLGLSAAAAAVLCIVGFLYFQRVEHSLADII